MNKSSLVFVFPIGLNSDGKYEYELYFSDTPDIVWAEDWAEQVPSICENIMPSEDMISSTVRVCGDYELFCAQNNNCFSMQDCIDGIISLAWCYDEKGKVLLNFKFAEDSDFVLCKLSEIGFKTNSEVKTSEKQNIGAIEDEYDDSQLVYIEPIGKNGLGWNEYDFYFSNTPDIVWGSGWECEFAAQGTCYPPDKKTFNKKLRLKTNIPFFCIQNNVCYGMRYAVEGIVAIGFEDISEYENYPEPYRIVFQYGEKYNSVETKLVSRHQLFSTDEDKPKKNLQSGSN
jgi:hypothetical protein